MKKRVLSVLLCAVLCFSLFPAWAFAEGEEAAVEDVVVEEEILTDEPTAEKNAPEEVVEENDTVEEVVEEADAPVPDEECRKANNNPALFEELKAALADPSINAFDLSNQGEFIIPEDLNIQGDIYVNTHGTVLVIPRDVTVTVSDSFATDNLSLEGNADVENGSFSVWDSLVITGTLTLINANANLPAEDFGDAFDRVDLKQESWVDLQYHAKTEAEIFAGLEAAQTLPDCYGGSVAVQFPWTLSRDLTLDGNAGLYVDGAHWDGSLVIPEGKTLSVNTGMCIQGKAITVRGSYINNGNLQLGRDERAANPEIGSLKIDGGRYSGVGTIEVATTENPKDYVVGVDWTGYESRQEDGWTVFGNSGALFDSLKKACAEASEENPIEYTRLSDHGAFAIPESITFPKGLNVNVWNTVITIPNGVTVTINGCFNVRELVVENGGRVILEESGELWIHQSADLKGNITVNNNWFGMPADDWNSGMMGTTITANGRDSGVNLGIRAASVEDISSAPEKWPVAEHVRPSLRVVFDWTLSGDFMYPNGVEYHITGNEGGSLTIPEGTTFENEGYLEILSATLTVKGTWKNNGFTDVRVDNEPSRIVLDGGAYEGRGDICVRESEDPESCLGGLTEKYYFRKEVKEDGVYFWMGEPDWTFADLEKACGKSYEPGAEDSFIAIPNRSRFTIEKDLTIPRNMTLHDHEGEIYVPEGVTLTVLGRIECGWLTVDGTVILTGGLQTDEEHIDGGYINVFGDTLGGSGEIQVRSWSHMDVNTQAWKAGDWIDHLAFDREDAGMTVWYDVMTAQEAMDAARDVTKTNDHIDRSLNVRFAWTLTDSLEIPDDMHVEVRGQDGAELTIPGNVTMTVNNRLVVQGADIYVNGTLVNRDELRLEWDENNTRLGKVTVSKNGMYTGEGRIWVHTLNETDARACLPGLDLSGFAVSEQDGGTLFTNNDALFAALKAAAAAGDPYFTLREGDQLVIPEDFTVPEGLTVSFWRADSIVIPKGVTLTVRGGMHGNSLTVGGTVEVRGHGDINVHEIAFTDENARLNLKEDGSAYLPVEVWSDGRKNHIALGDACELNLCMNAWNMDQLINQCTPLIGEPEPHVKYWIVILFEYVAESAEPVELGVLENVVLEFYKGDNDDENGSMTVGKNVSYAVDGELIFNGASTLTVQGTVVNNNWIQLVGDEKEGYGSIVLEKGAVYDGEGGIWVGMTQNAESRLIGFREYQPTVYQELMAGKQVENNGTQFKRNHDATEAVESFVERGYSLMLGREADPDGLKFYTDQLKAGQLTGAQMVSSFMNSPEFNNNGYTNEQIVTIVYQTMLDREPDPDGLKYHTNNLNNGICYDSLINNFSQSDEFEGICEKAGIVAGSLDTEWIDQNPQVAAFVMRNYQLALERRAAGSELNYYCEILLNRKQTPQQVAHNFVFSPECVGRNLSDRDFIVMLYHLYMNRDPDEGGMNYYLELLSGGTSREAVEAGFGASPEFQGIVASYGL